VKARDTSFSSVTTLDINSVCMQKVIASQYRGAWIIRGSLSRKAIMFLHRLRAVLYHRLLPVLPCLHLLLVASRHPRPRCLHVIAASERFVCPTISLTILLVPHLKYSKVLLQLDEKQYGWGQMQERIFSYHPYAAGLFI